jgi:3-oxoacyl-[acyl-carrier-protein] synthase-3
MFTKFKNKSISTVLTVLPQQVVDFDDEMEVYGYSEMKMKKLKKLMGYNTRRCSKPGEGISDYAIYGIKHLIDNKVITKEEIGAIIVTSTTPDYFIPPTSSLIQGYLGVDTDCVCIDISQGCCGYSVGLTYAFMTLEHLQNKKVLVVCGDMMSRKIGARDRASRPIIGDAVTITVVENCDNDKTIFCCLKNEGDIALSVNIPAGGNKIPCSEETAIEVEDEAGNWRSQNDFFMAGDLVLNFIINETPAMIEEMLAFSGVKKEDVDCFVCHQPNAFILKKLAEKVGVELSKMPNDTTSIYGNSNSATIPVTFCQHYKEIYEGKHEPKIFFTSFGSGLAVGGVLIDLPELKYCNLIDYPHQS